MQMSKQNPFNSIKLIALNEYFDEMVKMYESGFFPKVLLLSGNKGIGKFTLVFHFLNYVYSKKEITHYNTKEKLIDLKSNFYNSILNQTCSDVIFLEGEEGKNIKIDDIRNLKKVLSKTTLSSKPRFTIIDEVEFLNVNSVSALLKTLEEPTVNNFFILINNQQANLIETISSRCLVNNIFLNLDKKKAIINYYLQSKKIDFLINDLDILSPGLLLKYSDLSNRYKINDNENILSKLNKLLYAYKKNKDKSLINMSIFFVEIFFYKTIGENRNNINFLLELKSIIIYKINDFITYNLNINSVLNSIELKLKNVS